MGAARKQTPGEAMRELERNGLQLTRPGKRGPSLITSLKRYLDENPEYLEQIVMGMVHKARMGDHKILEMIWDRIDGAVVKKAQIETEHHVKRYGFAEPRLVEIEEPDQDADA
jgi:hypothetical protein